MSQNSQTHFQNLAALHVSDHFWTWNIMHSRVKVFLDFLHKFRGQFGAKNDLNECFKTISILKSGKSNQLWGIWNFLENDSKDFFPYSARIQGLIVAFSAQKPFVKKISFRSYFRSKMHQGSWSSSLCFMYCSKMLELCWNSQKMIILWFCDEWWCISAFLTKSCLCLPKILLYKKWSFSLRISSVMILVL